MEIVIPPFDLKSISPMISVSVAAIFILLLDVFCRKTFKDRLGYISFLVVIATRKLMYPILFLKVFLQKTSMSSMNIAAIEILIIGAILCKSNGGITISIV